MASQTEDQARATLLNWPGHGYSWAVRAELRFHVAARGPTSPLTAGPG